MTSITYAEQLTKTRENFELLPSREALVEQLKILAIGCGFLTSTVTKFLFLRKRIPALPALVEAQARIQKYKMSRDEPGDDIQVTALLKHALESLEIADYGCVQTISYSPGC